MKKIVVIRIRGTVNVPADIQDTLYMLRLRKKYSCVLLTKTPEAQGMVRKVENYTAFGEIDAETLKQLLLKRARKAGNKHLEIGGKLLDEFIAKFLEAKAELKELNIKPFFSLHPPRGGFKKPIKRHYPHGVLGYHGTKINELIKKML